MSVPTREEIIQALRIPEVDTKVDSLGRRIQKNNYNPSRGTQIFYKPVSNAEVSRVKVQLYNH